MVEVRASCSLAELLCALSFATDMSMGQLMEHGLKTGYIGLQIADTLHLPEEDRQGIFYGSLLKDAGCTACATAFSTFFAGDDLGARSDFILLDHDSMKDAVAWFWRHAPQDVSIAGRIANVFSFLTECRGVMKDSMTSHCEVGEMFTRRLGLPEPVQATVRFAWERWDGKGMAYGLKGSHIPIAARVLHLAQAVECAHWAGGAAAARAVARERQGKDFDPELVSAFFQSSVHGGFWQVLEQETAQETILQMKPSAHFDRITDDQLEGVCEVLADFADVKSRSTWNHSLTVADVAVKTARHMGLGQAQLTKLRLSALVHDLGKAAVPVRVLDKGEGLTGDEWERFQLHPYYTERVLSRVGPLADLAPEAASHHEWVNGEGYHRGLQGGQIPLGGRILAVADRFVTLSKTEGDAAEPENVLKEMRQHIGKQLDVECYEALSGSFTGSTRPKRMRGQDPRSGHLSDQEVEALQLVATGMTNRDVAKQLVISDKTVEHHLDHIYNKLGVSSRTSAVVFAVHQGIVT